MLAEFLTHTRENFPQLYESRCLIACSGGVDSMVLLDLCRKAGMTPAVAHCNFQLRGVQSEADAQFVRDYCQKASLKFHMENFDTHSFSANHRGSLQMAARELRYAWFETLMEDQGYDYLLTAHHLDDSIETFLINLSRGSGIKGLEGIPGATQKILRPLLLFSKEEIRAYAREEGLAWREDESNQRDAYLRNRVRHELIPGLKTMHPAFESNFKRTLDHLKGSSQLLEQYRLMLTSRLFKDEGEFTRIPVEALEKLHPLEDHLHLLFSPYGFTRPSQLRQLFKATNSKGLYSATHRLLKDRADLLLAALQDGDTDPVITDLKAAGITMEAVSEMGKASGTCIFVDKEKLNGPLFLRKWRKGDYFYPFGMKGRKKLSKFYKDEKFSPLQKEMQWLLCSGKDIVWVPGYRADERFRVEESTKKILKILWQE